MCLVHNRKKQQTHTHTSFWFGSQIVILIRKILMNHSQSDPSVFFDLCNAGNITLPEFQWTGDHYLYTTKCNYVDLNADENGLWAIYSTPKSTNTYVVKVNGGRERDTDRRWLCFILEIAWIQRKFNHINRYSKYLENLTYFSLVLFFFSCSIYLAVRSISLMQSLWKFSMAGILA